jgi:ribosomal 30S subunit maturation factor RimM
VTDLIETGAHDVLVLTGTDGEEVLVPNHPSYVQKVEPQAGRIVMVLPVYQSPPDSPSSVDS